MTIIKTLPFAYDCRTQQFCPNKTSWKDGAAFDGKVLPMGRCLVRDFLSGRSQRFMLRKIGSRSHRSACFLPISLAAGTGKKKRSFQPRKKCELHFFIQRVPKKAVRTRGILISRIYARSGNTPAFLFSCAQFRGINLMALSIYILCRQDSNHYCGMSIKDAVKND